MALPPRFLDELRGRLSITDVVGRRVRLIRKGRGESTGLCPFHNEKTPSFTVSEDKGFFHCFGCGAHGDVIGFIMRSEGLEFPQAVDKLAGEAGMQVPRETPEERERAERQATLGGAVEFAAKFFEQQLRASAGRAGLEYLKRRGLSDDTMRRFRLGFSPDTGHGLKAALEKAAIPEAVSIEAGLLIKPDDGRPCFDRFRGRVMFPILDRRGQAIAFGGRILDQGEPKYLNSPETPLFHKGRVLYGLSHAQKTARETNEIIVVEGYMDVIALAEAGIAEVVAPNGTAVTEAQLERMWRLDPAPILCFDGDSAGRKAAIRAAARALPFIGPERTLRFVELPAGQDPDDVVRGGGKQAFEALLENAEPLDERLWRHEFAAQPLTTPEARAGLRQRLIEHSRAIGDSALAQLYRDHWLGRFQSEIAPRRAPPPRHTERRSLRRGTRFALPEPPAGETVRAVGRTGIDPVMLRPLLAGCIRYPHALLENFDVISSLEIPDKTLAGLRDGLIRQLLAKPSLESDELQATLAAGEHASLVKDLLRADAMNFSFNQKDVAAEKAVREFGAVLHTLVAKEELKESLRQATVELGVETSDAKLQRQMEIRDHLRSLEERLASFVGTD